MILIEVALISVSMSFLLVILSKFLTNQSELKGIRKEVEDYREKINVAKKQKDEKAIKEYTEKMFKTTGKQFKESRKSMMVSMLVGLVATYLLQAGYTGLSFNLEQSSIDTAPVLKGALPEGSQVVFYDSSNLGIDTNKDSAIGLEEKYKIEDPVPYKGGYLKFNEPKNGKGSAQIITAKAPFKMPFFGSELSWFALYLFITLPTTLIFRKLLDVQ